MADRFLSRTLSAFATCILLMASASAVLTAQSAIAKLADPPQVLLQVVNQHFTVGKRIPSTYLKVLSDGTVECHKIRFGNNDGDAVKKTQLSAVELAKVTSVLNDSQLSHLKSEYNLQRPFWDSWMEWDITIDRPPVAPQNVTIAFAGGGAGDSTLPDALSRLGCLVLELRRRVYGDDGAYYSPACRSL